jgi:hypothetical protein
VVMSVWANAVEAQSNPVRLRKRERASDGIRKIISG